MGSSLVTRLGAVGLLLVTVVSLGSAQGSGTVAGTVTDSRLLPLDGVLVTVQGSPVSVRTDSRGRFRIASLSGTRISLQATRIGFRPLTLEVAVGDNEVRLTMTEAAVSLSEIVVTGAPGGELKRAIGNAIATVNTAELQKLAPAPAVTSLLNARVAGVTVVPGTGTLGAGPRINIRGQGSFSLSDQPLLYVDGVRVDNDVASGPKSQGYGSGVISRLNDFNPDDIESMQVIKGPAAATLYGTEAANGVIQIITKKGAEGRPKYEFTSRAGSLWFSDPQGRIPPNYYRDTDGSIKFQDLVAGQDAKGAPLYKNGVLQIHEASMSGGSSTVRYLLSSSLEHDNGIEVTNNLNRFTARTNLSATPSEKFSANASLSMIRSHNELSDDIGSGILFNVLYGLPATRNGLAGGFYRGPPYVTETYQQWQDVNRWTGSLQLNHHPFDWFTQRLIVGLDQTSEGNYTYRPNLPPNIAKYYSPTAALGSKTATNNAITYMTTDYGATATAKLSERLSAATSIGGQFYRRQTQIVAATGSQFPAPGLSALSATAITTGSDNFIQNTTLGSYLQEQLSWQRRLFLTAAMRVDNNSAFGENLDFVTYPKVSASWVVSDEPFWRLGFIDAMKLRAAYGQSGQQPQTYAALRSYQAVTLGGGTAGVTPQFLGNPDLKPERGQEYEGGFEAGLFDDRLSLDFTAYYKKTTDAILQRTLAPSLGYPGAQYVNVGALRNRGVELQLRGTIVRSDRTRWDLGFNFNHNDNRVLDLGSIGTIHIPTNLDTPALELRHQVGLPAGSWFGKKTISATLDAAGVAQNVMCDGGGPNGLPSGVPVSCATAPQVFLGRSDPNNIGSVSTTLTIFRRLTVYGLLDFKLGVYHGDNDNVVRCYTFFTCRANYYPQENDPRYIAELQSGLTVTSFAVANASYAKLREISLSYTMPEAWARKLRASGASVSLSARNLHTWSKWTSLDPETFWTTNQFDKSQQTFTPQLEQVVATLHLTF